MGKIKVKVKPNSSVNKVKEINENEFEVWTKEKPINNKANEELMKMMKKYFGKNVTIKRGFNSRDKVLEVEE